MSKPESRLRIKIQKALEEKYPGALFLKIHGGPFQHVGIPDVIGLVEGVFIGLEIKCPGNFLTKIQRAMIGAIIKNGGAATSVTSVEEALRFVKSAIDVKKYLIISHANPRLPLKEPDNLDMV